MKKQKNAAGSAAKPGWAVKTVALLLVTVIPFLLIAAGIFLLPGVFGTTFLGELTDKYERLCSIPDAKIVVVGGSSVAFGLDSSLLEELCGMPVVNFGLYATLGSKIMLDLSLPEIGEGDIVVLAPELDPQTLSLYFNAEAAWQACDSNMSMLWRLDYDNLGDMLGGAFGYLADKLKYLRLGAFDPPGVYNSASFDEYGDIVYPRPYNVMTFGYDINKPLSFSTSDYSAEFIEYLNEYIAVCEKRGAKVCYAFPPMNASAVAAGTDASDYGALYDFLCESLDCEILGSPADYIMDEAYFYDSNFHPNDAGTVLHTSHLAEGLRRFTGDTRILVCEIPEPGTRPAADVGSGEDGIWSELFVYEPFRSSAGKIIGYIVTGTAGTAHTMTSLEIPATWQGLPVMEIGERVFEECGSLRAVTIRGNIVSIKSGAFAGCPTLSELHIYNESETTMSVDQTKLFDGAADGITIWLYSEASYESYVTGYFWGNYGSMMKLKNAG